MKILVKSKLSEHKYKTPEGYLICVDSILARTGKQEYRRSEIWGDSCDRADEIVSIDRKPEEVFSDATLASFENKPLTVEHPDSEVDSTNWSDLSVGFVRDVKRGKFGDEDVILGTLVITDQKTIDEIEAGQHTDLSCGYDCDIEDSDNPEQKNIRGNHVALCEEGRAGIAKIVDSVKDEKTYSIFFEGGIELGYEWRAKEYQRQTKGMYKFLITRVPRGIKISSNNRVALESMIYYVSKYDDVLYKIHKDFIKVEDSKIEDSKLYMSVPSSAFAKIQSEAARNGFRLIKGSSFATGGDYDYIDIYLVGQYEKLVKYAILKGYKDEDIREMISDSNIEDAFKPGDKIQHVEGDTEVIEKIINEDTFNGKIVKKYVMKSGRKYLAEDIEKSWHKVNDSNVEDAVIPTKALYNIQTSIESNLKKMFWRIPDVQIRSKDHISFYLDKKDAQNVGTATVKRWLKEANVDISKIEIRRSKNYAGWSSAVDGYDYDVYVRGDLGDSSIIDSQLIFTVPPEEAKSFIEGAKRAGLKYRFVKSGWEAGETNGIFEGQKAAILNWLKSIGFGQSELKNLETGRQFQIAEYFRLQLKDSKIEDSKVEDEDSWWVVTIANEGDTFIWYVKSNSQDDAIHKALQKSNKHGDRFASIEPASPQQVNEAKTKWAYRVIDSNIEDAKFRVGYVDMATDQANYVEVDAKDCEEARLKVKKAYRPYRIFECVKVSDSKKSYRVIYENFMGDSCDETVFADDEKEATSKTAYRPFKVFKVTETDSIIKDNRLPKADRAKISNYLNMISTLVNRDYDIQDILRPLYGHGYKCVVDKVEGWDWKPGQYARKYYTVSIEGYDDKFLVTLYADPNQDWKIKEVNAYFTDAKVKDNVYEITVDFWGEIKTQTVAGESKEAAIAWFKKEFPGYKNHIKAVKTVFGRDSIDVEDAQSPADPNLVDIANAVLGKQGIWFARKKGESELLTEAYCSEDKKVWYKCTLEHRSANGDDPRNQTGKANFRVQANAPIARAQIGRNVLTWYAANGISNSNDNYQIDHINGNFLDDRLSNLERVTAQENVRRMQLMKRR